MNLTIGKHSKVMTKKITNPVLTLNPKLADMIYLLESYGLPRMDAIKLTAMVFRKIPKKYIKNDVS